MLLRSVHVGLLYLRCVVSSAFISLGILIGMVMKPKPSLWLPQPHPFPPKVTTDPRYGTHRYINANGVKLHCVENGDPTKQLVIFIHGFPEFWYSWRFQLEEFGKNYWCIAFDMRGYGDTDKPKGINSYKIDDVTDDIAMLIKQLGREKCILVGHDWGAVIGFHFVEKHMHMVEKYCMMDAPPIYVWGELAMTSWEQFWKCWYIAFFQMPFLPEYSIMMNDYESLKVIGGNKFTEYFTENDLEAYKHSFSQKDTLTAAINYYRANVNFLVPRPNRSSGMSVPGLYLLGEYDKYVSQLSGPMTKKYMGNLEFQMVKGSDHFMQQTNPEVVNEILREFFAK